MYNESILRHFRLHHMHSLLQQMSHVAWSVCLSVCVLMTQTYRVQRLNRSRCRLGADSHGPKEPCMRWGSRSSHGSGIVILPIFNVLLWHFYSVLEVFFIYGTLNLTFLHYITLYGRGQFLGVVRSIQKHQESLLPCMQQRDHSQSSITAWHTKWTFVKILWRLVKN